MTKLLGCKIVLKLLPYAKHAKIRERKRGVANYKERAKSEERRQFIANYKDHLSPVWRLPKGLEPANSV